MSGGTRVDAYAMLPLSRALEKPVQWGKDKMIASAIAFLAFQAQAPKLDADTQKLFAWYESFNVSQYLTKPFVKIEDAGDHPGGYGFLVSETEKSAKILTVELAIVEFKKESRYLSKPLQLRAVDLKSALRVTAEYYVADEEKRDRLNNPSLRAPYTTLAWLCSKAGLSQESIDFIKLDHAWNDHLEKRYGGYLSKAKWFAMRPIIHEAVLDFENEGLLWSGLQKRFEDLGNRYKDQPYSKEIDKIVATIRGIVAEEQAHVVKNVTQQDRIAEAIWRLPYSIDSGRSFSRSQELTQEGMAAIPLLIKALDDDRLTRSLWHPSSGPSISHDLHTIYKVSDFAREAIRTISGQDFDGETPEKYKKSVENWYRLVTTVGERGVLAEVVSRGNRDAVESAKILLGKYPEDAFKAITKGYRNSKNDSYTRSQLIKVLDDVKGKEVNAFLFEVAEKDTDLGPRVSALNVLLDRDPERTVSLATKEWESLKDDSSGFDADELITVLHASNQVSGIKALGKNLRARPVQMRFTVLRQLGINTMTLYLRKPGKTPLITQEVKGAIEDLIASELEDQATWNGSMGGGGFSLSEPMMSTVAMVALWKSFPEAYSFSDSKNAADLERQRIEALKTYRKRRTALSSPPCGF